MHESSQPRGDRAKLDTGPVEALERRRAIVLRLANGRFFRSWRSRGGGIFSVERVAQAELFTLGSRALEQARGRLRRLGVDAEPEEVTIVIGGAPVAPAGGNR